MCPIIELQRRLREIGRIRLGEKVTAQNGKIRPAKLSTFRFTSRDRRVIDAAAAAWGGTVTPWAAPDGQQWQVTVDANEVPVVVPPGEMAFSQWYETWSAGGCQRRCDGAYDYVGERSCVCDPDERECKMTTRLSVIVPDLPGFGLWRVESHGYYAAVELSGLVELCQQHAARGAMLPARLRLEQRTVKRTVQGRVETRNFAVPVLDIDVHPLALTAGVVVPPTGEIGGGAVAALPSGNLTPVPPPDGALVPSLREQITAVDEPAPRAARANAAEPIPSTGLKPRPAAQVNDTPPPDDQPPPPAYNAADVAKRAKDVFAADYEAAPRGKKTLVADRLRHAVVCVATKERTSSTTECTPEELPRVMRVLDDIAAGKITYQHDALDDNAGVVFTLKRPGHPEGDKDVFILWSQLDDPGRQGGGS